MSATTIMLEVELTRELPAEAREQAAAKLADDVHRFLVPDDPSERWGYGRALVTFVRVTRTRKERR